MPKVFLSYSPKDAEFAKSLSAALSDLKVAGFLDKADLSAGTAIKEVIRDSIRSADAMVVLLSPSTITSWVLFELGAAQALGKKVIPILLSGTKPNGALPEVLSGIEVLDARKITIREVANKVKAVLASEADG